MSRGERQPRVLHAPAEIAGQLALSAYGLREIGVEARAFARRHSFDYTVEPDIVPGDGFMAWLYAAAKAAWSHDVLHFYYGRSFLHESREALDALLLKRFGRKVVVEFVGSDVRMPSVEAERNPHYVPVEGEDDDRALARMHAWSRVTGGHAIICDPALSAFVALCFEHVHHVPFRIDTQRLAPRPPRVDVEIPLVVHAPSDRAAKGTRHVRAAVEELRARGIEFEYRELHGLRNREVEVVCSAADIVIDQLCIGSHGVFAVEAMSMAKPVICYLQPDVLALCPSDIPIVNATPDTLSGVLARWLDAPQERHACGIRSRAYAERTHDVRAVARRLLDVYGLVGQ